MDILWNKNDQSKWGSSDNNIEYNSFLQVVFVPMWIVLSLLCLLVLYYVIWSIIFVRTAEVLPAQRRGHVMVAVASVLLVIPLLTFQVTVKAL